MNSHKIFLNLFKYIHIYFCYFTKNYKFCLNFKTKTTTTKIKQYNNNKYNKKINKYKKNYNHKIN